MIACSSSGSNVVLTNRSKSAIWASCANARGGAKALSRSTPRSRRVRFLATAARSEEPADDVVQRVRRRQLRGVDAEADGELFGQPVVEQPRPVVAFDAEQLGPDDRDDAPVLDVVEQVVPGVVVEGGQRGRLQHGAHGETGRRCIAAECRRRPGGGQTGGDRRLRVVVALCDDPRP
ncbi:MAG TPA: hypothetical protein VGI48_00490 [Caldimonas sp.]